MTGNHLQYIAQMEADLASGVKHDKRSAEKLAAKYGITNMTEVKEFTELAIVHVARDLATTSNYNTAHEHYNAIVNLYHSQATLSHRTSASMRDQQYSTPAPIGYLMGMYVLQTDNPKALYFEPSAGNGLLTIALPMDRTYVNEKTDLRLSNLESQAFASVTNRDASKPFYDYEKKFDGIVSNPPFGPDEPVHYFEYTFKSMEQIMVLRALDTMKHNGRAAVIIGQHTTWDKNGMIQAGKNLIFFNYLYHHYHVDDVINVDGHKLYSRQGTAFPTRIILISGRKAFPQDYSPLRDDHDTVVSTFDDLYDRISQYFPIPQTLPQIPGVKLPVLPSQDEHPGPDHKKGKERFSPVRMMDRSEITTDPKIFQGRENAWSDETVHKILEEGFDKSQDPIIVWRDEILKKYVVISGHSRWRASKILFERGDTSLKMMPVKIFLGDKDDAVDYAIIESNRAGTAEGIKSDINAYKKAAEKGMNKAELLRYFKPESYLSLLKDLCYLNMEGRFIEYLSSPSEQSFPYLKRNAQWVGNLRRMYPQLTNSHETEIFDYLYKKGSTGLNTSKDTLYNLIDRKVMTLDFNADKPLNLSNMPSVNVYSDPLREQIREIEKTIADLSRQRGQKEELIAQARAQDMQESAHRFEGQVSDINKIIMRKIQEKQRIEKMIGEVEHQITYDLFSEMEEPAPKPAKDTMLMEQEQAIALLFLLSTDLI